MSPDSPLTFSIVIPTYNRASLILKTVSSALSQRYRDIEVVVVDDGSTDDTMTVLDSVRDPRLRCLRKENGERSAARNYGADRATGAYLTFLDSDDLLYPDHCTVGAEAAERFGRPALIHLDWERRDQDGRILSRSRATDGRINDALLQGNIFGSPQSVFVRRDVFREIRFNESRRLTGSEDWLFWLQAAARWPIRHVPAVTSALVEHPLRSVRHCPESQLLSRRCVLLESLRADPVFMRRYGADLHRIEARTSSYVALHLVLSGAGGRALPYLWRAMRADWREVYNRRTAAVFKHLVLGCVKRKRTA
jgi:glycosyltransferase involved in cell wall biosynthesis